MLRTAYLCVRHTKQSENCMKIFMTILMFLIASCSNNSLPSYENIILVDKLTGTHMRLIGEVLLSGTDKAGDSILYVRNINTCRYTSDSLFRCDQELKRDSFFVELNKKKYFVTVGVWCMRGCSYHYDLNPCHKYLNGYVCN